MIELKDTIEKMQSDDYKERFVAEYAQVKIRHAKLKKFVNKIEAFNAFGRTGSPTSIVCPVHDCPVGLLVDQLHAMEEYIHNLELRAIFEKIDLEI